MRTDERVLVIGGTQGTGELIVRRLLDRGPGSVRVLARTPAKAERAFGDRVEVVPGDITRPETLPAALRAVTHLIHTAGVTHRPAGRRIVRETVRDGTLHLLAAAREAPLPGRFLYMSALGTTRRSWLGFLLNLIKGNTLHLRREVEEEIRRSPLEHTIIHAGILTDDPPGRRPVRITQAGLALRPRYRISRADVAEVFLAALATPHAKNTTFDAVWAPGDDPGPVAAQLGRLVPDP